MNSQNRNKEIFETMPVWKSLWTMAVPTIIGQLIILVYNLADTFFVGRTNNPLMVAGVSIVLPIFNITASISNMAGMGGGSLISRLLGAGDESEARRVSAFSFLASAGVAALLALITLVFMRPILDLLGTTPDTYIYAKQYAIIVVVLGSVPTVLASTMANVLRSTGYAKIAGFGISMGGVVNMFLDPLFMYVLLPHGMEIIGAGVATLLSNVIVCVFFVCHIYKVRKESVITVSLKFGPPSKKSIKSVFSVGIPAAVSPLLFDVMCMVMDKLASGYGPAALAAIGIVMKAERFPLNIGIGISQGMMPIVAYNYSSGNIKRMRATIRTSRAAGLVIGVISVIAYILFAGTIMKLFINDPETVRLGTAFLQRRAVATPLMFLSFHMCYLFNAMGQGKYSLLVGVARFAVFNIPLLFVFNALLGANGIAWTECFADTLTVTLSFIAFGHFNRTTLRVKE